MLSHTSCLDRLDDATKRRTFRETCVRSTSHTWMNHQPLPCGVTRPRYAVAFEAVAGSKPRRDSTPLASSKTAELCELDDDGGRRRSVSRNRQLSCAQAS